MGVDVSMGPITNLDNKILDEVCPDDENATLIGKQENNLYSTTSREFLRKPIDIMQESVESDKLVESISEKDTKKDGKDEDEDIMTCKKREDELNTVVVKRRPKKNKKLNEHILPPGWEKHSDENGSYYWHVKSGTIQREYPQTSMGSAMLGEEEKRELVRDVRSSIIYDDEFDANHLETALTSPQPTNKNQELNNSSSAIAKDSQVQQQQTTSTSSMQSSNISSTSTSSGLSKSCTSSSIMDLGKEKETQKRRSLPPCKENDENGSSSGSTSGVRPMQV